MFKDYNDIREPLVLPINGKPYTIPPVTAEDGITLMRAVDTGDTSGVTERDVERMVLGDAAVQMRADGAPATAIRAAEMAAYADFRSGREAARVVWESDGHPKAPNPPKVASTPARTTRRRASGTNRTTTKN